MMTMREVKHKQLVKALDAAYEIRTSAYLWNNLPEESLHQIELACNALANALRVFTEKTTN